MRCVYQSVFTCLRASLRRSVDGGHGAHLGSFFCGPQPTVLVDLGPKSEPRCSPATSRCRRVPVSPVAVTPLHPSCRCPRRLPLSGCQDVHAGGAAPRLRRVRSDAAACWRYVRRTVIRAAAVDSTLPYAHVEQPLSSTRCFPGPATVFLPGLSGFQKTVRNLLQVTLN